MLQLRNEITYGIIIASVMCLSMFYNLHTERERDREREGREERKKLLEEAHALVEYCNTA